MKIERFSDDDLALALRCCAHDSGMDCSDCPCMMGADVPMNCFSLTRIEAASRLLVMRADITTIQAARDAMAKELDRLGIKPEVRNSES